MSKKLIIGIVVVIVLGLAGGYFVFAQNGISDKTSGNNVTNDFLPTIPGTEEKLVGYEDESGFSFSYPKSLDIEDTTPLDDDNYYSQLKLTKGSESLTIDVTVGNTNPYKSDKSATLVGSTTMAGVSTNQYSISGKLTSVAIDQGVLYVISGPKDGGFWEDAQSKILSTFKFADQASASSGSGATGGEVVYEEEVVE